MRIGMLVDMYKPHISGVTNYVALNKQVLEQMGHKVFIFTFGNEDYEDDELYVVRSPGVPLNVHDTGFHVSFRYSQAAQRKVKSMDLVHVHHPFLSGPLALRYCKSRGIPIVFTNHTRYDLYFQHYFPSYVPDMLGDTVLRAYLPNFCQQCDLTIAPSPGVFKVMRDLGVTAPVKVIPNGIDLQPFQHPPQRLTRAQVGLAPDDVVLIYVGRLSSEKNLAFLLRAFLGVAAARPGVTLVLIGDGPEMDNLKHQAEYSGLADRVKFFGQIPYAEIPNYLVLADAFVTASETEVHPLSLIEALAAGLPALGVQSPGVGDTIVDDDNGFLTPPELAAFTAKLMQLVMEPETRQRLAARARESAQAYDITKTAAQVYAEYERLVEADVRRLTRWGRLRQQLRQLLT